MSAREMGANKRTYMKKSAINYWLTLTIVLGILLLLLVIKNFINIRGIPYFSTSNSIGNDWKSYQANNFSIKFPSDWKVSTRQIEYHDFPTLELTKIEGKKMWGGYELPQLWIGSPEIYSTSGAICANESYCEKVDKISFSILGEKYSTDIFQRKIWEGGKLTDNHFNVFQVGIKSGPDLNISEAVTGQYETTAEKSEKVNILSSINY